MTTPIDPALLTFVREMPKVELHLHLGGAIQPETLLALAQRNGLTLPADTAEGLRSWYRFRDFEHFLEVYMTVVRTLRTVEDVELIAREFLKGQAAQHVLYTEISYGAHGLHRRHGLPVREQLAAIKRAIDWAGDELGVSARVILEIDRLSDPEEAVIMSSWAVEGREYGVIALALGGSETMAPASRFVKAFDRAREAGLPAVPHAGEVGGPEGIWDALRELNPARIEHGVRCLEDPALVAELRDRQIPLDVCPASNVALGVAPSLAEHPLPRLIAEGLHVTLNSDDPPMFNTTLTQEYLTCAGAFGWGADELQRLALDGVRATLLPPAQKTAMLRDFEARFAELRAEHRV
jgi:adenosine deaminase